jgi:hypothetical protein
MMPFDERHDTGHCRQDAAFGVAASRLSSIISDLLDRCKRFSRSSVGVASTIRGNSELILAGPAFPNAGNSIRSCRAKFR